MRGGVLQVLVLVFAVVCGSVAGASSAEESAEPPKAEKGESRLEGAACTAAQAALSETFARTRAVRARIEATVYDELFDEERKETGELTILRPYHLLRRFFRPRKKVLVLSGERLFESRPSAHTVYIKDFHKAPRTLALLRAAMTCDLSVLEPWFDVFVFKKPAAEKGKPAVYRFVLRRKPSRREKTGGGGGKSGRKNDEEQPDLISYRRIEARWVEGVPFFSELVFLPQAGDRRTERYSGIREDRSIKEADFSPRWPQGTRRRVDEVKDPPELAAADKNRSEKTALTEKHRP